jgi:phosphate starvation-inducible PhoH-like protein
LLIHRHASLQARRDSPITLFIVPNETIHFPSSRLLSQLYANDTRNLIEAERMLDVTLASRDDWVSVEGPTENITKVQDLFKFLDAAHQQGIRIRTSDFHYTLRCIAEGKAGELREIYNSPLVLKLNRVSIIPKTLNQKRYLQCIDRNTVTFGIGPAGTGKTYLAMAMALKELLAGNIERIILTRPAVEAGEALGFLPGELQEKILPYLTPLYDAMNDMMGKEQILKLVERGIIEIAPLAYMRGRTLANAFVVLDEAQNTTHEQMMMFLTRLGDGSRMVITGDITQIDLPRAKQSGLKEAVRLLKGIDGLQLFHFDGQDVVRHPLVQNIINAYARGAE